MRYRWRTGGICENIKLKKFEELGRTWTQIGLELGYDTNILNVLSGRSKNLGTKTALGSYTSANLKMAVSFYEQIIDRIS